MILGKKLFLFFKKNFTRINHCKFIHHKSHLKPFLSYLPCIVRREYFSIIFNVKKCALYLIKYGKSTTIKTSWPALTVTSSNDRWTRANSIGLTIPGKLNCLNKKKHSYYNGRWRFHYDDSRVLTKLK
jgi:hypothetical protein